LLANIVRLFGIQMQSLTLSVPDEGYSEHAWWRLFWACLMKVILSVPDEGYSERAWWRLFQKHVVNTKLDIYVFIILNSVSNLNTNDTWLYTLYLHLNLLNIIELYFVQSNLQQ
jgi:hypothetical protein